jgi:hypothetical protein
MLQRKMLLSRRQAGSMRYTTVLKFPHTCKSSKSLPIKQKQKRKHARMLRSEAQTTTATMMEASSTIAGSIPGSREIMTPRNHARAGYRPGPRWNACSPGRRRSAKDSQSRRESQQHFSEHSTIMRHGRRPRKALQAVQRRPTSSMQMRSMSVEDFAITQHRSSHISFCRSPEGVEAGKRGPRLTARDRILRKWKGCLDLATKRAPLRHQHSSSTFDQESREKIAIRQQRG